jgi:hypothetical protein
MHSSCTHHARPTAGTEGAIRYVRPRGRRSAQALSIHGPVARHGDWERNGSDGAQGDVGQHVHGLQLRQRRSDLRKRQRRR